MQIYHHYEKWEDWKAGMWRKVSQQEEIELLPIAIEFTGDHIKYGSAMLGVIDNWKYSSEHNLSNKSINRKAWIGHAACCFKLKLPEYIVRRAWWELTEIQRNLADNEALKVIKLWEQRQRSKAILNNGKAGVIQTEYQMKLQMN